MVGLPEKKEAPLAFLGDRVDPLDEGTGQVLDGKIRMQRLQCA